MRRSSRAARPRREAHGARGRDHLGWQGHGAGKIAALRAAGAVVADTPDKIGAALVEAVQNAGIYEAVKTK